MSSLSPPTPCSQCGTKEGKPRFGGRHPQRYSTPIGRLCQECFVAWSAQPVPPCAQCGTPEGSLGHGHKPIRYQVEAGPICQDCFGEKEAEKTSGPPIVIEFRKRLIAAQWRMVKKRKSVDPVQEILCRAQRRKPEDIYWFFRSSTKPRTTSYRELMAI